MLEVKDCKVFRRDEWIAELKTQMVNARCQAGTVIVKKAGTSDVGDWYALLPFGLLVPLVRDAGY